MMWVKQSTAATLIVGPILDSAGAEYALAGIGDLSLSKNGGSLTPLAAAAELTYIANGQYLLVTTTGNLDTLGRAQVTCNKVGYQMPPINLMVFPAMVFDSLVLGTDYLEIDLKKMLGGDPGAVTIPTAMQIRNEMDSNSTKLNSLDARIPDALSNGNIKAYVQQMGANSMNASALAADAVTEMQSGLATAAQVTALNNLSAKANWFGYPLLEVPDSGTRSYVFELVVRDDEDKLINLDALPTIAFTNAAGTDRSALITTGVANPSTGRYTITITVNTSSVNESLKLSATGAIGAELRYAVFGTQIVDYDTATQVNQILTRLGTPAVSVSADIAAVKADTGATLIDTNELQTDLHDAGRLDLILDATLAASVLVKQLLKNKVTVQLNTPSVGLYTYNFRNDDNTATVASVVFNPATGERP